MDPIKNPIKNTLRGRIIAGFLMFIAIIAMNILIGDIASELTVGKLSSYLGQLDDLKRLNHVFCIRNSFGENLLKDHGIQYTSVDSIEEGLKALEKGEAQAFLGSEPTLKYKLHQHPIPNVKFLSAKFGILYYSYILPEQSTLLRIINRDLLDLIRTQKVNVTLEKYLGK